MRYEINFCFPKESNRAQKTFMSADSDQDAKDKFYRVNPHLRGCRILSIGLFKD